MIFCLWFFLNFLLSPFQLHKQADMQEEKNRIERVLGAISAPDLIQKVLNFALSVPTTALTACSNTFLFLRVDRRNERSLIYRGVKEKLDPISHCSSYFSELLCLMVTVDCGIKCAVRKNKALKLEKLSYIVSRDFPAEKRWSAREHTSLQLTSVPPLLPQQEEVRPQDTVSVIGGVAGSSKQGRKAAWKFVKDNWEELYNRYQGGFLISRLIKVNKRKNDLPRSCVNV